MNELTGELAKLSSAEEFLQFFAVPFDQKVVNVSRLHILKRFYQYLRRDSALAGLDSVSVATGLVFDADEIRDENKEYLAKVDDQVEGNAELTAMLHTLEERYDSYMAGSTLAQPIIHTGDLPSADELAAELERFLADRRDGDDRRGRR